MDPIFPLDNTQALLQTSLQRWLHDNAPFERRANLLATPAAFQPLWTGLAQQLADWLTATLHGKGVWLAFIGVYLATAVLTETMTNNAAAALIFPLAWSLAEGLGANPLPFALAVAYAASASFILPFGYQTNLMVFNAARYSLKDFWRVGVPVSLTHGVMVCWLLPKFFPF